MYIVHVIVTLRKYIYVHVECIHVHVHVHVCILHMHIYMYTYNVHVHVVESTHIAGELVTLVRSQHSTKRPLFTAVNVILVGRDPDPSWGRVPASCVSTESGFLPPTAVRGGRSVCLPSCP